MPRRSGTITVWSCASRAASGAHMSPVSPNPWSSTTAGPCPPTRTKIRVPFVAMVWVLKPAGNGWTWAGEGVGINTALSATRASSRISKLPLGTGGASGGTYSKPNDARHLCEPEAFHAGVELAAAEAEQPGRFGLVLAGLFEGALDEGALHRLE